jgi:hypothetical protein
MGRIRPAAKSSLSMIVNTESDLAVQKEPNTISGSKSSDKIQSVNSDLLKKGANESRRKSPRAGRLL